MIEKQIKRKLMFKGSLVSFYRDEVLINQEIATRDVCVLNDKEGTIQAFCYDTDKNVYMVSQYRHVKKQLSLSCVGGYIEKNETPESALLREVKEELGAKVIKYKKIFTLNPLVAYTYEQTHMYLVEIKPQLEVQNLDEFEDITIKKLDFKEFLNFANSEKTSSLNVKIFANYLKLKQF